MKKLNENIKIYFAAEKEAKKKIHSLLISKGIGYRNSGMIDSDRIGWLISSEIKKQIEDIKRELKNIYPFKNI